MVKTREEYFWEKVNKHSGTFGENNNYPTECWGWLAYIDIHGYSTFWYDKRMGMAHVYSYKLYNQDYDSSLDIDHLCRNRSCVNPEHLEQITHKENVLRGIGPTAINAIKTHCDRGHELSGDNLYSHADGGRACNECRRINKNQTKWKDKTHCKNGHLFTEENSIYKENGGKWCRDCLSARSHRAYLKRK